MIWIVLGIVYVIGWVITSGIIDARLRGEYSNLLTVSLMGALWPAIVFVGGPFYIVGWLGRWIVGRFL